jgi:hypothetical protein
MCIIIDINTLSCVFDNSCSEHPEFKPVKNWIIDGEGFVVYGGKKYIDELKITKKYLAVFIELKKKRKVIEIDSSIVDTYQKIIESKIQHRDFDDPHIVAIISASKCRLVCSKDLRSFPFLKRKELYPKGVKTPMIYSKQKNINLLCSQNIVPLLNIKN